MARQKVSVPARSGSLAKRIKAAGKGQPMKVPMAGQAKRPAPMNPDAKGVKHSTVTFARLFANASSTDAKYAPDVHLLRVQRYKADDGVGTRTITLDEKPPRKYIQIVLAQDGQPVYKTKQVWVSCSCKRFLYYWEYALHKRNASEIRYGNGEPPMSTNPRLMISCCKHVLTVLRYCLAKKV
jgi:hypothetical protein